MNLSCGSQGACEQCCEASLRLRLRGLCVGRVKPPPAPRSALPAGQCPCALASPAGVQPLPAQAPAEQPGSCISKISTLAPGNLMNLVQKGGLLGLMCRGLVCWAGRCHGGPGMDGSGRQRGAAVQRCACNRGDTSSQVLLDCLLCLTQYLRLGLLMTWVISRM